MKLRPVTGITPLVGASKIAQVSTGVEKGAKEGAKAASLDTVHISEASSFRASLQSVAKKYGKEFSQGISETYMAELKAQYQGEACPIKGWDTAGALLTAVIGPQTEEDPG